MRDILVGRNYEALKLAQWISYGSYWKPTMTEVKALNLLNRGINHPAVVNRWNGRVETIVVDFVARSSWAGTWDVRGGKAKMRLPLNALNELTVLHELAHCFPGIRREPHHGPGFAAIHLMLIELLAPQYLAAMYQAYKATGTPVDISRIPPSTKGRGSQYFPLLNSGLLDTTSLGALLATGGLTQVQRKRMLEMVRVAGQKPVERPGNLPDSVSISTAALLRCNTSEDVVKLVQQELKRHVTPSRMVRPKKPKKPSTTREG